MLQHLRALGALEGDQPVLLQMVDFDVIAFLSDDLLKMVMNDVLVGSIHHNSDRLSTFVVAGDGVIDDTRIFVEEHCQVALAHALFAASCIKLMVLLVEPTVLRWSNFILSGPVMMSWPMWLTSKREAFYLQWRCSLVMPLPSYMTGRL